MADHKVKTAEEVLTGLGWAPNGRYVTSVAVAGAGNMNLVERVTFDDGTSVILKRAHGWVEKYPEIPAPIGRAGVEAAFYAAVAGSAAGLAMPAHLGFDEGTAANLFADLGAGVDGMAACTGAAIAGADLDAVADWMRALHSLPVPTNARLANPAMRELNALHIFDFPLDPNNGFDVDAITAGLQSQADLLKQNTVFIQLVQQVKDIYLGDFSGVLLHGDLYPGSWLTTPQGLFVIDPEFCWIGPREWDLGVLIAHLKLSNQGEDAINRLIRRYDHPVDMGLTHRIAGIEIMRRLIGVAQLPLTIDLAAKTALLNEARTLVIG
jgi:5-methylthioribose kinase